MPFVSQAFVLGAGLGTRLHPLTDDIPKPLVPIFQKPLITFALDHLIKLGVTKFIVNTHHLPERFTEAFPGGYYRDFKIEFVHEPVRLETGGGIKNIETQLGGEPFITYSGDVLTDIDLEPLVRQHVDCGNDVTLGLRQTGLASAINLQGEGRVSIAGKGKGAGGAYDFANVAIWNSTVFGRIPPNEHIGFIPVLADWIAAGGRIGGVVLGDGDWFNIGSRNQYLDLHRTIAETHWSPAFVSDRNWTDPIAPTAQVDPSAKLLGCSVVGQGCQVGEGVTLRDTILWPGAQIASRSELIGCIVRSGKRVTGVHRNIDI